MVSQHKYKLSFTLSLVSTFTLLIGQLGMVQPLPVYAGTGTFIIEGDNWTYFKGSVEPPSNWNTLGFDDGSWLSGPTGIGYGDGDDATVLDDMQGNYLSVYIRRTFTVADPTSLAQLMLEIDYDDGFVAYLNGIEVARRNLGESGEPVPHNAAATSSHEAGAFETIDVSAHLGNLVVGANVLAIQAHNESLNSSDLSMIPELRWGDNQPRYPYLQKLSTNTVTIVWTTTEPGPSEVHYSTDLSYSNVVAATSTFKSVDAPDPYDEYYEHVAVLSNLASDTIHNYAIYTQGIRLAANKQLHFRTHPSSSACTFNFAVFGDTGINWQPTWDVRDQAVARGFGFALNAGDQDQDSGTYEGLETKFFKVYQDILSNRMMWTTMGNHEYVTDSGAPYVDVFHLPEQALYPLENERYYSFDYGNAHFVILDTNASLWRVQGWRTDDMADWLEADLAANDSFWTIVVMHHPWYVSDNRGHFQQVRDKLVPLFEEHDVDIVLTGHDHLYERTFPIKDDVLSTVEAGGVIYVTNGEGGSNSNADYDFVTPAPDWSAARSKHDHVWDPDPSYYASYTHIYVDNGIMSLITIDDQGNVIDPIGSTDPVVIINRSHDPGASCAASVSGTVYEDTDGDGTFSSGDTPLADVQIDLSDGQSTTTTITASGVYTFANLTPGSYTVTENDPPGYSSVTPNVISITLASGDNVVEQDFLDRLSSHSSNYIIFLPIVLKEASTN